MTVSSARRAPRRLAALAVPCLVLTGLALPAPVLAADPAAVTVTVRIEGRNATLLPTTTVVTRSTPVPGAGCPGNTVAGAIDVATAGNWDQGIFTQTILGETHAFGPDSDYWAEWVNNRLGGGICNDVVAAGDAVLMHVDFSPPPAFASTVFPIEVSGVPPSVDRGESITVSVAEHKPDATFTSSVAVPAAGVTVAGGGASAVTGADGKATLSFATPGTYTVQASRTGGTRSIPASICVHDGADGTCGTSVWPPVVAAKAIGPTGSIAGVTGGQTFAAARAPRELRGTVLAGSSPVRWIHLRLLRRQGTRCAFYSAVRERFSPTRVCERGWYFYKVAERPDWSYLLPERLGAGRYTLEVVGTDLAGLTTRSRTAFTVKAAPPKVTGRAAGVVKVGLMVAGRTSLLFGPRTVAVPGLRTRIGNATCAVAPGTPLGALESARRIGGPPYRVHDYGSCSPRTVDAGGLFVTRIGPDSNAGLDGWVYKVGRRAGTTSAADPTGPFGTGRRLRGGDRVVWFYCRHTRGQRCQRTLEVGLATRRPAPGAPLAITVTGYDDEGRGTPVAGAALALGPVTGRTDRSGRATLTAPTVPGAYRVTAERAGLIPAFPETVEVG